MSNKESKGAELIFHPGSHITAEVLRSQVAVQHRKVLELAALG